MTHVSAVSNRFWLGISTPATRAARIVSLPRPTARLAAAARSACARQRKGQTRVRAAKSDSQRAALYSQFEAQLAADIPAVFLYAPDFVYIVPNNLQGLNLGFIESPSDRFLSVAEWHLETQSVWPIFVRK